MALNGQIKALKGFAQYFRLYRNKVFVIKLGGAVLADLDVRNSAAQQCALLADMGIRVVIVHGGGPQTSELSRKLGAEPVIIGGRRVTDDAALDVVKMVIAGRINVDLVAALRRAGARPVGISGIDAGLILADRRPPVLMRENGAERTVDFGNVGDIREVHTEVLDHLLAGGYTPVISCLGATEDGSPLNINADILAETLAATLKAKKLVYMTDQPGVLRDLKDRSTLLPFADLADLKDLLESGAIAGGMKLKVEACLRAATNGVKRTHIIDGTAKDSLLVEVFTGEGCGTMIVGEREKQIYQEKELA